MVPNQNKGKSNQADKTIAFNDQNSETTVYADALRQFTQTVNNSDAEITFKKPQCKSTQEDSDETIQVDTSDEMLEMDYADKFIADCTEQT